MVPSSAAEVSPEVQMGVVLEIRKGEMAGKVIALRTGDSVAIGRSAAKSQFALPHDTFLSGLHFSVECGAQGCRVADRKSSNGTFLNGAKIHEAMLANGDEIKAGQTVFSVKIVPDAKIASMQPVQEPPAPPTRDAPASPIASPVEPDPPRVPPPQKRKESVEIPSPEKVSVEPPPSKSPEPLAQVASDPSPAVEERPQFRAIPRVPQTPAAPPRNREAQPSQKEAAESEGKPARAARRASAPPDVAPAISSPEPSSRPREDRLARDSQGASRNFAFRVMGWSFPSAPAEWQVQEGFGLQQVGHEDFPGSVAATEEPLGGITLAQFVESQISTLRGYLRDARIEPTLPPRVHGADESMAVDVRHSTKDGRELVYRRIYARSGSSVGVLTVTTVAQELPQVLETLKPLLDGAAFQAEK
jgi:hypothetical protein